MPPGSQVTVSNLTVANAKLDPTEFLMLSIFDYGNTNTNNGSGTLYLSNLTVVTDCYTLMVYQTRLLPTLLSPADKVRHGCAVVLVAWLLA